MTGIIKPANLPEFRVELIVPATVPAIAIEGKLKQSREVRWNFPRMVTLKECRDQMLQDPLMGDNPDVIAIHMSLEQLLDKSMGSLTTLDQGFCPWNRQPV